MKTLIILFFILLTLQADIISKQKLQPKQDELRLMLDSFLYSGDVNNAYKVARLGYKKYPKSLYWLEKSMLTALWSNHILESLQYKKQLYKRTHSAKLRDEIIEESLKLYQYESIEKLVIDKFKKNPSKENAQLLLYVEYQIGNPQKAAKVLQNAYNQEPKRVYLLTNLLKIYMDTGDIDAAKKITAEIEKKEHYTKENIFLLANYYYIRHNIQKSYTTLLQLQEKDIDDAYYYKTLSDFGWYLNDTKNAAKASEYLIKINQARVDDYDRVVSYYKNTKRVYSAKIAKEAYFHYHKEYFFFHYAATMLEFHHYDALRETMNILEKQESALQTNARYWLLKAKLANYYGDRSSALDAITYALALESDNFILFQNAVFSLIEIGAYEEAKSLLLAYEQKHDLSIENSFVYASLYFQLNEIDRANYYLDNVFYFDTSIKDSLEFLYLQASIHEAQAKRSLALQEYRKILQILADDFQKDPRLTQQDDRLLIYFAAALNVFNRDHFERELAKYRTYLTPQEYTNIRYSLAIKARSYEKSHSIYTKANRDALWMQLSDALLYTNYTKLENLLYYDLEALPKQDATAAAKKDMQLALAQTLSFQALQTNRLNNNAYLMHLDLAKKRDDLFDVTTALYDRDPLVQTMFLMRNRTYLRDNFYLYAKVNLYKNNSKDKQQLFNLNSSTTVVDFGVKKEWQRLQIFMHYGYKKALVNYVQYGLLADYKLSKKLDFYANYEHAIDVEDSTYLYVGGKKDMLEFRVDYAFLNSFVLDVLYQKNSFYSQDSVFIGKENYFRTALNKQFRAGYPDLGVGLFFDKGSYFRASPSNYGVLGKITNETVIMPENFYNVGAEFRYGMQNAEIYTRVWRPYFSISPYYNSFSNNFDIGLSAGYGGKVYKNDHLIFGFDYSQPTNGLNDKIYKLFVNYKILY